MRGEFFRFDIVFMIDNMNGICQLSWFKITLSQAAKLITRSIMLKVKSARIKELMHVSNKLKEINHVLN